jgi:ABC-type transporter Mla subunit MlaD
MSDISSLSHDHATSASLAEDINASLIKLKKAWANTPGARFVTQEEIRRSRENLARVVDTLLQEISKSERTRSDGKLKVNLIPEEFTEGIRARYRNRFSYFVEDLREALDALKSNRLSSRTISLLDEICDVADTTASITFRRLWRR